MHRPLLIASLSAALFAAAPTGTASAATVGSSSLDGETIVFSANPGEANRLTVSRDGNHLVFDDPAAVITPGPSCTRIDPRRASCEVNPGGLTSVELGDKDDEATTSGAIGDLSQIYFDGEQGNDTLRGNSDHTSLSGGTGENTLIGGPGTISMSGVQIRGGGSAFEMPELFSRRDTITCAPRDPSLPYRDVNVDELDVVSGDCGADVSVYTASAVVSRGSEGDDLLNGSYYPSRLDGLGGNDRLFATGTPKNRSDGGPGNDTIESGGLLLGGEGDDVLSSGIANEIPVRQDGGPGNDQLRGRYGGDRLVGGPGSDRISGNSGNDYINARDGEVDSVRCGDGRSDRAVVDRSDKVARDCEKVSRR